MVKPVSKIGKIFIDLNIPYDPTSSLPNIYPRKMKMYVYQKFVQNIFNCFYHDSPTGYNPNIYQLENGLTKCGIIIE